MKQLFNAENGLWQLLGFVGDCLMLSLLWVLCSVPLVTLGAASAALYDAALRCFRRGERSCLARYLTVFRREWKNGILPSLLCEALLTALLLLWRGLAAGLPLLGAAALSVPLLVLPLGIAAWVFPMLSRFTLSTGALLSNSLRLALSQILRTLALGVLCFAGLWLTLRLALLPVFFLPALLALGCSFPIEPVFRRYEEAEEAETSE